MKNKGIIEPIFTLIVILAMVMGFYYLWRWATSPSQIPFNPAEVYPYKLWWR